MKTIMRYPLAHVTYGHEEIAAVNDTLMAGQTTCGKQVQLFERHFADYVGRRHAIMVNSGSSADLLVAYGLGPAEPGEEVLIPAVTWPTQVWSCLMAGYTVRLVDVNPASLQFNVQDVADKINPNTKALFPVHVLGNVGQMDMLMALADSEDLTVIEDCCESLGARYKGKHTGTFGSAAAYSFFFSHLINTMEGGMVVTDTVADDHDYRLWRSHGWEPKKDYRFWFTTWGLNIRPTELQGAFGRVQMRHIAEFKEARTHNANQLTKATVKAHPEQLLEIEVLPVCEPSWHGFPIMVSTEAGFSRDELCRYLDESGIENRPIVAGNLARQPAIMGDSRIICGDLPGADTIHDYGFYIGLASFNDDAGTDYVGEVVSAFIRSH